MSGLHPFVRDDEETGGRFRLNTNRRQELTVQMELDAVAMKSITEIKIKKEEERNAPISETEVTAR